MTSLRCVGLVLALAVFAACGRDAGHARSDLKKMNYEFTANEFVRAARAGDEKAVRLFLDGGMDVNASASNGDTALLGAADGNAVKIIELLAGKGADYSQKNQEGWTPFMRAIYGNELEAIKKLVDNSREDLDRGLLLASLLGHTEAARILLKNGAEVDAASPEGNTSLSYARKLANKDLEKLLLEAGADSNLSQGPGPVASVSPAVASTAAARGLLLKDLETMRKSPEEAWWKKYGLNLDEPGILTKDSDHDGFTNSEEFLADTSPIDPSSHPPAAAKLTWEGYHRENLPYALEKVENDTATLKTADGKDATAKAGETLGDWKIERVRSRLAYDKDGHPYDGSDLVAIDPVGKKIRLVPGIEGPANASYAAVKLPFSEEVQQLHVGEKFTLPNDGTRRYEVLDLREEQVVLKELGSGQTFTISK